MTTCSLNAPHFKMHPGAPAEPVLAAWGIDTCSKPVFVGLGPTAAESTDAWDEFLADLAARGLRAPLLVISDGAPGLISAAELHFSRSLRQRCLIHRLRNALAKVSATDQDAFKAGWWAVFDGIDEGPGEAAVGEAARRAGAFAASGSAATGPPARKAVAFPGSGEGCRGAASERRALR